MGTPQLKVSEDQLQFLASPRAVRERASRLFEALLKADGKGTSFRVRMDKLDACADYVFEEIRRNYPRYDVPFHSRYEHLRAGGVDRLAEMDAKLSYLPPKERVRSKIDLVVVSVLLDAGAGGKWSYHELGGKPRSDFEDRYMRSEGLAVASFRMFESGLFSAFDSNAWRADADRLEKLSAAEIGRGFQVSEINPMVGLEGRAELLKKLGKACRRRPEYFGSGGDLRPGNLIDHWFKKAKGNKLSAVDILQSLLFGLADMWPARATLNGVAFGDVWQHPLLGTEGSFDALMPFHKLSQWLAYSLIEPAMEAGLEVTDIPALTGLPEYRNGGLLLDLGVLELTNPADAERAHTPDSRLVIEWRALTVALLDRLAERVRSRMGKTEAEMPLAKILQGGTWLAGRRIAREKREGGAPPLTIDSDGTVF